MRIWLSILVVPIAAFLRATWTTLYHAAEAERMMKATSRPYVPPVTVGKRLVRTAGVGRSSEEASAL